MTNVSAKNSRWHSVTILPFCFAFMIVSFVSCKKEYSCEGCNNGNTPPKAAAGPDQVITLPTDSVLLDGSASNDPDGTIIAYQWTKIKGPASFTINAATSVKTVVKSLAVGMYQLELKVTDDKGLSAKDTMTVTINPPVPNTSNCNFALQPFLILPSAGSIKNTATAGNKILFNRWDGFINIYDTSTQSWSTVNSIGYPSTQRTEGISIGSKILFSAPEMIPGQLQPVGHLINIYDAVSNSWTENRLTQPKAHYPSAVVGSKLIYAGGNGLDTATARKIDIYDASSNSWTSVNFSEGRRGMGVAGYGSKVFFAGGYITKYDSLTWVCDDDGNGGTICDSVPVTLGVDRVDIWDMNSNTWSVARISEPRGSLSSIVVGGKIIFAGGEKPETGGNSKRIDIYDVNSNTWAYTDVQSFNVRIASLYSAGSKLLVPVIFSNKMNIYDLEKNNWTVEQMPGLYVTDANEQGKVASVGNKIVFYVQFTNPLSGVNRYIDFYDASTNTWCHGSLSWDILRSGIVTVGNRIFIAGGGTHYPGQCCAFDHSLDTVWYLDF